MSTVRHDYYQSGSHIFVSIFRKGIEPSSVKVDARSNSVSVLIGDEQLCTFAPLREEIRPEQVTWKVFAPKIELVLPKLAEGRSWSSLIGDGTTHPAASMHNVAGPSSQPSSSATSKPATRKKWDEVVDRELGEEKQETADDFMKDLYSNASPEAQRAMLKSYQESGGTVLSTNWADVGSRKVEVAPPDGMEAKSWKS